MKKKTEESGLLFRAGVKNRNGRIYPLDVLNKEIERFSEKIDRGVAFGELGHPEEMDVSLKRVSHIVTGIRAKFPKVPRKKKKAMKKSGTYRRDTFIVNYRILDTETGRVANKIKEDLVPSPRGMGSVGSDGIIDDNYKLLAVDLINKKDRA